MLCQLAHPLTELHLLHIVTSVKSINNPLNHEHHSNQPTGEEAQKYLLWKARLNAFANHLLVSSLEEKVPSLLVEPKERYKLWDHSSELWHGSLTKVDYKSKTWRQKTSGTYTNLCIRIHSKSKQRTQCFSKCITDRWNRILKGLL